MDKNGQLGLTIAAARRSRQSVSTANVETIELGARRSPPNLRILKMGNSTNRESRCRSSCFGTENLTETDRPCRGSAARSAGGMHDVSSSVSDPAWSGFGLRRGEGLERVGPWWWSAVMAGCVIDAERSGHRTRFPLYPPPPRISRKFLDISSQMSWVAYTGNECENRADIRKEVPGRARLTVLFRSRRETRNLSADFRCLPNGSRVKPRERALLLRTPVCDPD